MRPGPGAGQQGRGDSRCLGHTGGQRIARCIGYRLSTGSRTVGFGVAKEKDMIERSIQRLVREGEYVAEVGVTLIEAADGWTPYVSLEDAYKLDDVREALRAGDISRAAKLADRVYRLTPVSA